MLRMDAAPGPSCVLPSVREKLASLHVATAREANVSVSKKSDTRISMAGRNFCKRRPVNLFGAVRTQRVSRLCAVLRNAARKYAVSSLHGWMPRQISRVKGIVALWALVRVFVHSSKEAVQGFSPRPTSSRVNTA